MIYSCFAVPYKTAFSLERMLREDPTDNGMSWDDWFFDAIFYLDIVLNFWTGYDTGYMIVTDKTMIAKHYLRTRFPIDFVSTVEWDLITRRIVCGNACIGEYREYNDMTALRSVILTQSSTHPHPILTSSMYVVTVGCSRCCGWRVRVPSSGD